jgi:hypothetical protein
MSRTFKVWSEDETEEDAWTIEAYDVAGAAEEWAEVSEELEGDKRAESRIAFVREVEGDGSVKRVRVRFEWSPSYTGYEEQP